MTGSSFQDDNYTAEFSYEPGSPHLRHSELRRWIARTLSDLVAAQFTRHGQARVLEIGAGHGTFTEPLLAAGAVVTTTEMSSASAAVLRDRYQNNSALRVIYDPDGSGTVLQDDRYDLVVCISVLHHIPDYLSAINGWVDRLDVGGSFVSFQDPLWYPRRSRTSMMADRGAYAAWRLTQPGQLAGVRSSLRRAKSGFDEEDARDMVEYHVLRSGCDEAGIMSQLKAGFTSVQTVPYWSTQSSVLQHLGQRLKLRSTFAVIAQDKAAP